MDIEIQMDHSIFAKIRSRVNKEEKNLSIGVKELVRKKIMIKQ